MVMPDDVRSTIRRLRSGARIHAILATLFVTGAAYAFFDRPDHVRNPSLGTETVVKWEVVLMGLSIAIVNVFLALSKRRRAARLTKNPDADHPVAQVFE